MVHNLFDEYRFFPNYPDLELDTTAALFGALLHHQLLTNITLGMALRHVLQVRGRCVGMLMRLTRVWHIEVCAGAVRGCTAEPKRRVRNTWMNSLPASSGVA